MKRTIGMGILSAAAILGSGTLCAAPQGPGDNQQAGGPPPNGAQCAMAGERQPMQPPMQPPRSGMPNREQLKQAGATDAQIQALTDAEYALRLKQIDLRAAAEKAELALQHLMAGANAEEKAVMAAADALSQARGELFKQELAGELQRKQILGDELLRKLHEMRPSERQGNRKPGMGSPGAGPNAGGPNAAGHQDGGNRPPQGRDPRAAQDEGNLPPPPPPVTE
jgi:hypothetical protein